MYRTSILGRKDLIKLAFSDNNKKAIDNIPPTYTSRVIEIFNTTLKVLGIQIDFVNDDEKVKILDKSTYKVHKLNDKAFVCTDYEFFIIETVDDMRKQILERYPVITRKKLNEILNDMINKNTYLSEGMSKDLHRLVESYNATELENVQASIGEEVNKMEGLSEESPKEETNEPTKKKKTTKKKVEESKEEVPKETKKKTTRKKKVEA